jgi:Domain of unknown function (DUF4926)
MFNEYDVVVLRKTLPGTSAPVGAVGTVVFVHDAEGHAYEVEFFDVHHKTIDVCTVIGDEHLELKTASRDTK